MPLADSAEQTTVESTQPDIIADKVNMNETDANAPQTTDASGWEPAALPGTVGVIPTASTIGATRESELLTLIHDLNECNDALLSRVSQLETALDESQRRVQAVSDRAAAEQSKMAEQLSAEQISTQQVSQTAQQQIANVVAQLETAEQSLQRQQLINETLRDELGNAQERVGQLEHECALSAQQHAEEAQSRVQAETTIRDLRSRLQRQQRYTLQFKAALEKSLSVSARSADKAQESTSRPIPFSAASPTLQSASNGVSMPKAQRIMPWAGGLSSPPFGGIDPHLENLIRSANTLKQSSASSLELVENLSVDSEAESKLRKDMERVIENAPNVFSDFSDSIEPNGLVTKGVSSESDAVSVAPEDIAQTEELTKDKIQTLATAEETIDVPVKDSAEASIEPKLNWQRRAVPTDTQLVEQSVGVLSEVLTDAASKVPAVAQPDGALSSRKEPLIQALGQKAPSDRAVVIDPYTVPVGQTPAAEVVFSEPSPWGKPLLEKDALKAGDACADGAELAPYFPTVDGDASSVSPTVNPLSAQKKIGSMSAVQLPTFGKAKAGSFKR